MSVTKTAVAKNNRRGERESGREATPKTFAIGNRAAWSIARAHRGGTTTPPLIYGHGRPLTRPRSLSR